MTARAWAEGVEQSICDVIDSLTPPEGSGPQGHDSLLMLRLLDQDLVRVDGGSVGARWLILFDDVEKLTRDQRNTLRETLLEQRSRTTVSIAERLEALSQETPAAGALEGRDYEAVINLEEAWRQAPARFESSVASIAERRARMAADVSPGNAVSSFAATIDSNLDAPERAEVIIAALKTVKDRVQAL